MKPLIDADVLRYEIGSCGQYVDEDGNLQIRNFEFVARLLDDKVAEICELVWATEEPILFLTVDTATKKQMNRPLLKELRRNPSAERRAELVEITTMKPNFRYEVASVKPYKEPRKASEKPFHYDNLTAYIMASYDVDLAEGLEADDRLAIVSMSGEYEEPIICSRDKDLRQVPCWQFGWSCGKQDAFGPVLVDEVGTLEPHYRVDKIDKLVGTGYSFFCAQLLTGDNVDNIPGLPSVGPAKAWGILEGLTTYEDMLKAVRDAYKSKYEDKWDDYLLEQSRLLWMVREVDENNNPVQFTLPEWLYEG